MLDVKVKDSPVKTEIACMLDGTIKTRDITNKGKWVTDPKNTYTYDKEKNTFVTIIKSITTKFTKNPFKPGFVTTDKTITIIEPKLTYTTPTKTDHLDPSTGKEWGVDPKTDKVRDDIKDVKWPKDPVTGKPKSPVDLKDDEKEVIKNIVNPVTGVTYDKDPKTGKDWPKTVDKIPEPVPLKPVVVVEVKPVPVVKPGEKPVKPVVDVKPVVKPRPKPFVPVKKPTGLKPAQPKPAPRPVPKPRPAGRPTKPYKPV